MYEQGEDIRLLPLAPAPPGNTLAPNATSESTWDADHSVARRTSALTQVCSGAETIGAAQCCAAVGRSVSRRASRRFRGLLTVSAPET